MIIDHDTKNQVIVFSGDAFDPHDAPSADQLTDMILETPRFAGQSISVSLVFYEQGLWFAEYDHTTEGA